MKRLFDQCCIVYFKKMEFSRKNYSAENGGEINMGGLGSRPVQDRRKVRRKGDKEK